MTGMRPTSRFFGSATEFSACHRKTTGKSSSATVPGKSCCAVITADYVTLTADLHAKVHKYNLRQKFEKYGLVSFKIKNNFFSCAGKIRSTLRNISDSCRSRLDTTSLQRTP